MPRDSSGNYSLPGGNPVVSGTTITSSWANGTMSDIANEIGNSLSRDGQGGMRAPFKFDDGAESAPSATFTSETTLGFYKAATQDWRFVVGAQDRMRLDANDPNPLSIWNNDPGAQRWERVLTAGDPTNPSALWLENGDDIYNPNTGGVGIGTDSPTSRLQIGDDAASAANVITLGKRTTASATNLPLIGHYSPDGIANGLGLCATSTNGAIHFFTGIGEAGFGTDANAERMRITEAGNVGIGTNTPVGYLAVNYDGSPAGERIISWQVGASVRGSLSLFETNPSFAITDRDNNPLYSWTENNTTGQKHIWYTAQGTERMRLDPSGDLGIGTTTPSYKLQVIGDFRAGNNDNGLVTVGQANPTHLGGTVFYSTVSTSDTVTGLDREPGMIQLGAAGGGGTGGGILFSAGTLGKAFGCIKGSFANGTDNQIGRLDFLTRSVVTGSSLILRQRISYDVIDWFNQSGNSAMRIDATGNVCIGATAQQAAERLLVVGSGIRTGGGPAGSLQLYSSNGAAGYNETWAVHATNTFSLQHRDGSGGFVSPAYSINWTTSGAGGPDSHVWSSAGSAEAMRIDNSGNLLVNSTTRGIIGRVYIKGPVSLGSIDTSNGGILRFENAGGGIIKYTMQVVGTQALRILNDGGIGVILNDGANSWSTASDVRLKDVGGRIDNALDAVDSLSAVRYQLKSGDGIDRVGLLANEVQKVLPEAVDEGEDGMLSMRYTDVIPLLVAAVQELKQRIH
jgi:hypothetical protein